MCRWSFCWKDSYPLHFGSLAALLRLHIINSVESVHGVDEFNLHAIFRYG